ncbi:sulfatase [Verrucomicrobiota bacterium]
MSRGGVVWVIAAGMALLFISGVSAFGAALVDYQFNDAAGVDWKSVEQSGTDASQWNYNFAEAKTDGAGNAHMTAVSKDWTRKNALTAALSTGTVTLEYRLDDWNLDGSADSSGVSFNLDTTLKFKVESLNSGADFRLSSRGSVVDRKTFSGAAVATKGLTVKAVVDLDGNTYSSYWKLDGDADFTTLTSGGTFTADIAQLICVAEGTVPWGAGDYLDVDYVTVTVGGNTPLAFSGNPVVECNAATGSVYSSTLADDVSGGDGGPLIFSIESGPAWLSIASGGALSGTPVSTGLNEFSVKVIDGSGDFDTAFLHITVSDLKTPYTGTNVLFIAIDDMNPIVGCYGNALIQTPNMDTLAARGMLFENAHCQWSVCGPSRASLMTGLMPEQGGVMGFVKMRGISADGSRDNASGMTNLVTIPQHFKNNGYETAASGKLNDHRCVGSINPDGTINEDGGTVDDPPSWSYAFSKPSGSVSSSTAVSSVDGKTKKLAAEGVDQPGAVFDDGVIATEGLVMLNELAAGDKPFFLGVGFKKPHLPFLAPKANWDLYQRDDFTPHPFQAAMANVTSYTFNKIKEMRGSYYLETDSNGYALSITDGILPDDQQKLLLHGYYACISHVDDQVGRLLDELDALGLADNTIVVLWGDHGFHLGDHNEWGKHTNLEQATRVPFIISAPGYPQGLKTAAPAGLVDIYPTLCELAGLPIPEQPLSESVSGGHPLAGHSLVPVLADPDARVQTGIMNHYGSGTYGYAYRTERYRYIEWVNSSGSILARELYDYVTDPMETVNLAVYPAYDALMYQFSRSMRSDDECGGCDRLKSGAAVSAPADMTLAGLTSEAAVGGITLRWPDAAAASYNVTYKTNLLDAAWTPHQSGVGGGSLTVQLDTSHAFYRIELAQ